MNYTDVARGQWCSEVIRTTEAVQMDPAGAINKG